MGDMRAAELVREYSRRKLLSRRRSAVEALRAMEDAIGLAAADERLMDELPASLAQAVRENHADPAPLLAAALSPEIQAIHAANGAEAKARGVLGSPTYFVGGDMFYGQDRLEMLERALVKPFAPPKFFQSVEKLRSGRRRPLRLFDQTSSRLTADSRPSRPASRS